jgi:hypothetical protein
MHVRRIDHERKEKAKLDISLLGAKRALEKE